jgi:uncharacterized protein
MKLPDLDRARDYALHRLERELPVALTYHTLAHTRDDVVPAAERLAALEGITGEGLLLVLTAALYHDLGFVEKPQDHEATSARLAAQVLPRFGYRPTQVRAVQGMILATHIPQRPHTPLEEIVADADLDVLGRNDFWARNGALRAEMEALGGAMTDEAWYRGQLGFLRAHRYFTASARALRQAGKERHMAEMEALLAQCGAQGTTAPFEET